MGIKGKKYGSTSKLRSRGKRLRQRQLRCSDQGPESVFFWIRIGKPSVVFEIGHNKIWRHHQLITATWSSGTMARFGSDQLAFWKLSSFTGKYVVEESEKKRVSFGVIWGSHHRMTIRGVRKKKNPSRAFKERLSNSWIHRTHCLRSHLFIKSMDWDPTDDI